MKTRTVLKSLVPIFCGFTLFSCTPVEIILHGNIYGYITDFETSQPVNSAAVKLNPLSDTTRTDIEGYYQFTNLLPKNYEVTVSKMAYEDATKIIEVIEAYTTEVNFVLKGIPSSAFSAKSLDFGFDTVQKSFKVYNAGKGKFNYLIYTDPDWITVDPNSGEITNEGSVINVTINRTGLSGEKHIEFLEIFSKIGTLWKIDTVEVLLNGIMDNDGNYYSIVTIGDQTWMAENLNTGIQISHDMVSTDNGKIEKYCYDGAKFNCDIYGGLYKWPEAMDYNPSDFGETGTTRGVCPVGWHMPTSKEWITMITYLGGFDVAGGKLKSKESWFEPNVDATNETGFTGLGTGIIWDVNWGTGNPPQPGYFGISVFSDIWSASTIGTFPLLYELHCWEGKIIEYMTESPIDAVSVRCIKDP